MYTPSGLNYVMLLLLPVFVSISTLATRKARRLGESVVTSYMALSLFLVFLLVTVIDGQDLMMWRTFSLVDWVCLFITALCTIFGHSLRFMALQKHTVSALEPYNFLQPLQSFAADLVFFNKHFTLVQFLGMDLVVFVYLVKLLPLLKNQKVATKLLSDSDKKI